jgi:hypothetical protein
MAFAGVGAAGFGEGAVGDQDAGVARGVFTAAGAGGFGEVAPFQLEDEILDLQELKWPEFVKSAF